MKAINYKHLVAAANIQFPGFGITEIITGYEGFDDQDEVATTSMYELPADARDWIISEVKKIKDAAEVVRTNNITAAAENETVAFHIGRGGRFYNSGHLSFIGTEKIDRYINDLFPGFENEYDILKSIGDRSNLRKLFDDATSDNTEAKNEFERRTGLEFGEEVYRDMNGNNIITFADVETGIGTIDIDGDYNTTYTKKLSDCTEGECEVIRKSENFRLINDACQDFVKWMIDEEEDEE